MPSLTAHLVTSGDHGRLGFHPDCPVCRQGRLFGSLNSNAVVSPRAKAALASGVLAFSAVGPAAAIAQEPDLQLEGGSEGAQTDGPDLSERSAPLPPDETSSPPVPEPTPAPDLASPSAPGAGEVGSDLDDAPVDREPVENQSPPAYPPADPGAPDAPDAPDDPADYQPEAPAEPGAETDPGSTPSGEDAGTEPQDDPGLAPPRSRPPATPKQDSPRRPFRASITSPRRLRSATPPPPSIQEPSAPVAAAPEPALSATTQVRATTEPAAAEPAPSPSPAGPGYVIVEPGDSLWSIAARLLGKEASPARIARKVSQLWTLNADRIGTGRPDLVLVGTKLKLR